MLYESPMKRFLLLLGSASSLVFVGCGSAPKKIPPATAAGESFAESSRATAELKNGKGKSLGSVELIKIEDGVRVVGEIFGISPGRHGFHVHQNYECKGPTFKTAGDHFNPKNHRHGLENPAGSHAGDLPNIVADTEGRAKVDVLLKEVSLATDSSPNSLLAGMGTTLVIHAKADDQKTDPAGASGDRIACGLITKE